MRLYAFVASAVEFGVWLLVTLVRLAVASVCLGLGALSACDCSFRCRFVDSGAEWYSCVVDVRRFAGLRCSGCGEVERW